MIKFVHNYKVIHSSGYEVRQSKRAGEVLPTTGHEGREGAYLYSFTFSLTSALDGGGAWGSVVIKALRY